MHKNEAKVIIDTAWARMVEIMQTRGNQEARHDLVEIVNIEHRKERLPLMLAKARIIETVIKGAQRPTQDLATWRGIRVTHLHAAVIGAAYRNAILETVWDLDNIVNAGDVFFNAWAGL